LFKKWWWINCKWKGSWWGNVWNHNWTERGLTCLSH
jgi:hypothetical protein